MALDDKNRWNKKYSENKDLLKIRPESKKLHELLKYTKGKQALDLACGTGRNSIFLAKNNFKVNAIDISQVALNKLNENNNSNITTILVDLDEYEAQKNFYDLIVMSNFLDRDIIINLQEALKKDGILFIETYMHHETNTKSFSNPDFLLEKEELKSFFGSEYEILAYDEFDNEEYEIHKMKKQSIIVKKL